MNRHPISDETWAGIRAEFTLPALQQVRRRLSELMEDPEPIMRQLVRVFIDDGTFCPGFQFLPGGQLHPTVTTLFRRALELGIPHNYYSLWMIDHPHPRYGWNPPRRPPERQPRSPAAGAGNLPVALKHGLLTTAASYSPGSWEASMTTRTRRKLPLMLQKGLL